MRNVHYRNAVNLNQVQNELLLVNCNTTMSCFMAGTQPAIKFGLSANTEDDVKASTADVPAPAKPAAASPSGWGAAFLQASPCAWHTPHLHNFWVPAPVL